MSEEILTFVHLFLVLLPNLQQVFAHYDRKSRDNCFQLDFVCGNWRPPLVPAMAYSLESAAAEIDLL